MGAIRAVVCPECGAPGKVLDSRPIDEGTGTRRRWECGLCHRWTTLERLAAHASEPWDVLHELAGKISEAISEAKEQMR